MAFYKAYEDTLTNGDSPLELDVLTDLEHSVVDGYITVDNENELTFSLYINGSYGDEVTIKQGEVIPFNSSSFSAGIDKIRLTYVSGDSQYRIFAL